METILSCLGQCSSLPPEVLWALRPPAKAEPGDKREHGYRQPWKVTVPTGAALQGGAVTVFLPHQLDMWQRSVLQLEAASSCRK